MDDMEYAGFWIRVAASLIDTILLMAVIVPVLLAIYGKAYLDVSSEVILHGAWDAILNYIFPAAAIIIFWIYRSATPGKILLDLKIVDAETGGKLSAGQCVGRYFAYYLSTLPLLLGFFWVAFDRRKQGWHDKLAGTLVIKDATD